MRSIFIISAIALVLTACGGGGGGGSSSSGGGGGGGGSSPHLTLVHSGAGPLPGTSATPIADYEMGDLKTTVTYIFAIRNPDAAPLTDVSISVNHPDVTVSPAFIASVPQGDTPVFLTVTHGREDNLVTPAPTLAPGKLFFTLSASNAGVSDSVTVGADIKVANCAVNWIGAAMPLLVPEFTTPITLSTGGHQFNAYTAFYTPPAPSTATAFMISNTGNATFTVRTWIWSGGAGTYVVQSTATILVGNSATLICDLDGSDPVMRFSVDADGVEFKSTAMPPSTGGVWYGLMRSMAAGGG